MHIYDYIIFNIKKQEKIGFVFEKTLKVQICDFESENQRENERK